MLSSLGARRDRSRSPPEGHPPSKVFIQAKEKLIESDVRYQSQHPNIKFDSQCHKTSVPKIVVQEYTQEKVSSPKMPFTYAQALMHTGSQSPPEGKPKSAAQEQQLTEEKEFSLQHQQLQQVQHVTQSVQWQELKQPQEVQQQQMSAHTQQQKQKEPPLEKQQHQQEMHKYEVQQHVVTHIEVGTDVKQTNEHHKYTYSQETPVGKPALSPQELKSRKAQAMKNRPWLQKPATGEFKGLAADQEQDSTQESVQTTQTVLQSGRERVRLQPEEHVNVPEHPQQQQKEQQRQIKESDNFQQQQKEQVEQHETVMHQQQQLLHQEKQPKQKKQLLQQEQQKSLPIVKQTDLSSDTTVESQNLTMAQLDQQTKVKNLPAHHTPVPSKSQAAVQVQVSQQPLKTMHQTNVIQDQSQTQVYSQPQGPTQLQLQSQTCVLEGPLPSTQPQGLAPGLAVTQTQTWTQVKLPSPMQVSLQGQVPASSHIQLRSHPQSWAPVRPPSPKPQMHAQIATQSGNQSQIHAQPMPHSQTHTHPPVRAQTHSQSTAQPQPHSPLRAHSQVYVQSMPQAQAYAKQMAQQSHSSPMTQQSQDQFVVQPNLPPLSQYSTPAQSAVQHQGHISQSHTYSWTQVRASSPMSGPHPQIVAQLPSYPEGYTQAQSLSQQWIPEKELQNQAAAQQRYLISQQYPKQLSQAPKSQAHPSWPQAGSQVDPQIGQPGYSHMGYSQPHMQTQNQPWTQTPPQVITQISMHQQPQMKGYEIFQTQTHQGQLQQQPWAQALPHLHPQPYLQSQSEHYSQHQTQHQAQSQMQTQVPFQLQPQNQPLPQPSPHAKFQTSLLGHPPKQPQFPASQPLQPQLTPQFQQPPQQKHQSQFPPKQNIQSTQLKGEFPEKHITQSPNKAEPLSKLQGTQVPKPQVQMPPEPQLQAKSPPQPKVPVASPSEVQSPTQPKHQLQFPPQPQVQAQSPPLSKDQMVPPLEAQSSTQSDVLSPTQNKSQGPPHVDHQAQLPQTVPKSQSPPQPEQLQSQGNLLSQVNVLPQSLPESPELCVTPPALAQAPPQAYTEAYTKAQALARNGFEEAKHCLQEHIRETINIFEDKRISVKQASLKEVNSIILI